MSGAQSVYVYGQGIRNTLRSRKFTAKVINHIAKNWDPKKTFAQIMDERILRTNTRWLTYPTDVEVLMVMESRHHTDAGATSPAELAIQFSNPGPVRRYDYQVKFLRRLKKLLKRNPQARVVQIIGPAVMGQGFFSYMSDQEALDRLMETSTGSKEK